MDYHDELRRKGLVLLQYLYGNKGLTALDLFDSLKVGAKIGYSEDETVRLVHYLREERMIEVRGSTGKQYLIRLGPRGSAEVGKTLSRPEPTKSSPPSELTATQENDYAEHGYKCRDKIDLVGRFDEKRRNIVVVNARELALGDKLLELLLRFVVAARSLEGGWLDVIELTDLGISPSDNKYQPLSTLRERLGLALLDERPRDFVEGGYSIEGTKRYRISTHPDFISFAKSKLLTHLVPSIRRIAEKLPED